MRAKEMALVLLFTILARPSIFKMLRVLFNKIVKLNSIDNIHKTLKWKNQSSVASAAVHTTRSEHQSGIVSRLLISNIDSF